MSISSSIGSESWQIDFEKEEINDERWSCIVAALVETEPKDEECLKILNQYVTTGKIPLIRTVSMADVVALFRIPTLSKKKEGAKLKDKTKMENGDDSSTSLTPSRFPEVVPFLSKYAIISESSCELNATLMAYALKYLIVRLKDQNYYQRRVARTIRLQTKEAEVKAEVMKTLKDEPREKVIVPKDAKDELWQRDKFDIFDDPFKDGPFYAPELYIVLEGFYDPSVFPELIRLKVPFRAVIKIENFRFSIKGEPVRNTASKKAEMINDFWKLLMGHVSDDIALLKYVAPNVEKHTLVNLSSKIATGLTTVLYSIFHVHRLHQTYLQEMKVQRMIESLEMLDLSKCVVYSKLCDSLITEDPNAEIFVLFSMIEQVVAGVPETKTRILDYERKPSIFFESEEDLVEEEKPIVKEHYEPEIPQREKGISGRSKGILFHDDKISFSLMSVDSNVLKSNEMFERFVINSISSKIRNKFMRLTPTVIAQNGFSFDRLSQCDKNKNKDYFKVKFYFFIAMKLIERIKVLDIGFGSFSNHSDTIESENENTRSIGEDNLVQNESYETYHVDIENLIYKQTQSVMRIMEGQLITSEVVRKVKAMSVLDKNSSFFSDDQEAWCGKCPKLTVYKRVTDYQSDLKKVEELLESSEISHLNDPNLLVNTKKCKAFVQKHNFYEKFEPNRTVQKLQELFDEYNTAEYNYFSSTDTLFVIGHNDSDFRGVYHCLDSGFITSPLRLRDFVWYILPENRRWVTTVNAKYIKFLKGIWTRILDEEKRRDHEIRCGLMKEYHGMTESEKKRFLDVGSISSKESGLDNKKGSKEKEDKTSMLDIVDLPQKEKQKQPDVKFFGINCGEETRVQVNVVNCEFHSEDGSVVGVKTLSWLESRSLVTFSVRRQDCQLILHSWLEGTEKRMMLFRESSGILVTFDLDTHPFPVKITQPNGLLIEIGKTTSYIKQTFLEPYKWGEDIAKEKFRCCLRDGSVLIFCVDGTVEVLYPSGTKYVCRKLASKVQEVEIYDVLTPTGELWVRDDCSKCKRLEKKMMVLIGVDNETQETYYKREDGTNCMLWPDGKLVTTFPDGTKITTTVTSEEGELIMKEEEKEEEEEEEEGEEEKKDSPASSTTERETSNYPEDPWTEVSNGFTVVTSTHLIEHPKYATVYSEPPKLEVRILGKMNVETSSGESLRIKCNRVVLNVSTEKADFFTVCRHCGERSISKVFFGSQDLLSKSKDLDGKKFYVYNTGQVLRKPDNDTNNDDDDDDDNVEEPLPNIGEHSPSAETVSKCPFHKTCKRQKRCLIVERDLTGMEFIDDNTFHSYQANLSQDAYFDLGQLSNDKTYLQHAFFDPVYQISKEKYITKYEKDDALPTRLTRKHLRDGNPVNFNSSLVRQQTKKQTPKAIIARFIRVLLPEPMKVMKEIKCYIERHRKRTQNLFTGYGQKSKTQNLIELYIAKELELIASTLCPNLNFYQHTRQLIPYTEIDIHSTVHDFDRNNYFVESNPADFDTECLPRCKRIPKPLKHKGNHEDIHEVTDDDS